MDLYEHTIPLVTSRNTFNKALPPLLKSVAKKQVKHLKETQVTTAEGVKHEDVEKVQQKIEYIMEIMKNAKDEDEKLLQEMKQSIRVAKIRIALKNSEHYKILHEL